MALKLLIATPGAGNMSSRAHWAISAAIGAGIWYWYKRYGEAQVVDYKVTERMPVDEARNTLARAALQIEADYIWWIDDDMEPPPYALQRLHAHDAPIVSAFCAQRVLPPKVMAFRFENGKCGIMLGETFDGSWLVDAVGMACVLMKREVLLKVWEETKGVPFQKGKDAPDPRARQYGTEEMFFFELASQKFGFKTVMDCDLDVGHLGLQRYDKSMVGSWGKRLGATAP